MIGRPGADPNDKRVVRTKKKEKEDEGGGGEGQGAGRRHQGGPRGGRNQLRHPRTSPSPPHDSIGSRRSLKCPSIVASSERKSSPFAANIAVAFVYEQPSSRTAFHLRGRWGFGGRTRPGGAADEPRGCWGWVCPFDRCTEGLTRRERLRACKALSRDLPHPSNIASIRGWRTSERRSFITRN